MPRSILRPQVGSIVWYYADVTNMTAPVPAMVIKTIDRTHFDLAVFAAAGNALTAALNTLYFEQAPRPSTGAACTYIRTQENVAGTWPKMYPSTAPLGVGGVAVALENPDAQATQAAKDEDEEDVQGALRQGQAKRQTTGASHAPPHTRIGGETVDQKVDQE